ncbi:MULTISPECIES: ATP-binding protein [Streptomyces]|uniref:ATP-binding protein n=1 Tax=Streptomyces bugieae TaxID=3098223 RepID=A0ABU7NSD2_9ACTN|nr:ATP-binding protein [Streptomyces nigrescens]MEE4421708.1 ATP-binding protein [Streptomyces sp. DSM 41528]
MIGVSDSAAEGSPAPGTDHVRKRGRATGSPIAEWSFPADPGAVRTARTVVRRVLNDWGLNGAADVAVLLVSELVTNSLRHATGPIGVRMVLLSAGELLVEVSDPLPDPPQERTAAPDDEGGRGLQLVACSSRRWGTRRGKSGKTVWFELSVAG